MRAKHKPTGTVFKLVYNNSWVLQRVRFLPKLSEGETSALKEYAPEVQALVHQLQNLYFRCSQK
jgi:hypothetical protein